MLSVGEILQRLPGGSYVNGDQYYLPDGGDVRAATPGEVMAAQRGAMIERIKQRARAVILAVMPEWKQANATARAVQKVSLGETSDAEWQAMQAVWAWVQSVRNYSDDLEAAVAAAEDPASIDIDTGWPALQG